MKSFIIKNWVGMFLLLLVLSLSFLGWIAIEINDGLAKFLEKPKGDDKRMDVIGSIFGTSVAIASALVAIILARTALLFAENEEKREFRVKIEERIKTIQDVNNKIINSAKELRFIANDTFVFILNYLDDKKISTVTSGIDDIFKEKFNKNKEPLRKFADAIKQLDSNSLIFKHYQVMLEKDKKDKKDEKDGYKPSDVIDIAVAMENKFIDNLNVIEIWNHISKHFGDLQNKSEEFLEEFSEKCSRGYKIDKHEFFKWVVCSLIMGFSLEKNNGKIQSLLFIDILLNLPSSESFKKISESLESEFYQNHQEYAKKTIDFLAGQIIEERIPELRCVRKFLGDNQEFLEIKISANLDNLDNFLKLAKGIAIENNQKEINSNVIFTAMSYLDLSPYGKAVFSKMMGDRFYRIEPATGGQEYIDLADSKREINIPLDVNMKIFVDEVKEHLGNKDFFTIR